MTGKNVHRMSTTVLSLAMAIIGLALVVQAVSGGGAGMIARLLLGILFVAAGSGRLYLQLRGSRHA
jgi:hypothetical protein